MRRAVLGRHISRGRGLTAAFTCAAVCAGLSGCGTATRVVHPAAAALTRTVRVSDAVAATASATLPLAGRVVGVDPGHNGRNYTDPGYIDHQIWNGREYEDCDTTGTETDSGYTEARFNWNVAGYLVADLHREGAHVVLTRHSNDGVGPCVTRRAQIMNRAHVAVEISIHADGGPANGRGFAILEPVADGINDPRPSRRFARILRSRFEAGTSMPVSTYDGIDGLQPRDDLAGENLVREPYALIECGNMRNATDAALLTSSRWQRRAAAAIASAITRFLR
ncbi:MAG TPA: N-acetylmuramoyl-L-alanine amidase [Solirubrobacteraceae bacterium]|nr:N-acetylmuramoyl-L-alanine amidase [Solirubrobacteraceae bacterium]